MLLPALSFLARSADVPLDPIAARDAARTCAPGDSWPVRLARAASRLELAPVLSAYTIRDLIDEPELPLPLITSVTSAAGRTRFLAVTGRHAEHLHVTTLGDERERTRRLGSDALAAELGVVATAPMEWVGAAPASPLEAMRSPGHGELPPWVRLWRLLRLERDDILVVMIYAVAVGLLSLASPIAVQALVNSVAFGSLLQPVLVLALVLMGVLSFAAVLKAMQVRVVEYVQRRLFVRTSVDLAHRLPRVDAAAWDREYGPELVNRFFDVLTIQKAASTFLLDGVAVVLQATIGLVLLGFYHPLLLAFDLVLLIAVTGVFWGLARGAVPTAVKESKAKYEIAGWLQELTRHPTVFASSHGLRFAEDRADALAQHYLEARESHFKVVFRQTVGSLGLQVVASAALLGLGGMLVIERQLTLGQLVAAELVVATVLASLASFPKYLDSLYDMFAASDKLGHLVDLPLESAPDVEPAIPATGGASVRLRDVHFAYEGRPPAVEGVSLEIAPGSRVALDGPSGAGKSTVVQLIYGRRVPTSGAVLIDGVDTREVSRAALRGRAALLGTEPEIFEGSVADNVAAGHPWVGLPEVHEALEKVGLTEEVQRLEQGVHTRLHESGGPLSEGQARRLMVARALVARPRLIIADEILDGIEPETRMRVLEALTDAEAPWTLIVVTHDEDVRRVLPVTHSLPGPEERES